MSPIRLHKTVIMFCFLGSPLIGLPQPGGQKLQPHWGGGERHHHHKGDSDSGGGGENITDTIQASTVAI